MSIRVLVLSLLMMVTHTLFSATLDRLDIKQTPGHASINTTLTGRPSYKVFVLQHPTRVVIDFQETSTAIPLERIPLGDGVIIRVRRGPLGQRVLRLVFDVKQSVTLKDTLTPSRQAGHTQLHLELSEHGSDPVSVSAYAPERTEVIPALLHKKPVMVQHAPSTSLRNVIVVLDPGHGGKDPGATGPRHIKEKEVVLAIAYKLKQMIDKQPGMHAVLTRNGDYYVGLRERLNIARRYNADIFISIHADAFINQHSNGASVFALSQTGATSEAARWLAEKENYSELGGVNLSHLNDQNGVIRTVLLDLSQTATISASVQMGTQVLHHLDKITSLHNQAVEQARFVVLKSPDIPSVLVETGFITNPREERNLSSPVYQAQLTQAIFNGVKRYFWDHPPHGTRLEALTSAQVHIVRAGESLPMIADHYHVRVADLKTANHLSDMKVTRGQSLSIPLSWG